MLVRISIKFILVLLMWYKFLFFRDDRNLFKEILKRINWFFCFILGFFFDYILSKDDD